MNTKPSKNKTVVLVGPTASGKTGLLDRIFGRGAFCISGDPSEGVASGLSVEVISADSMQAYRGMDIGTAKAGPEILARLPHHLLDIRDPDEQYTAGDFARLAVQACSEVRGRDALPVVCGGTGFYVRNFLCGVPTAPAADPAMRSAVAMDLARFGAGKLREELKAIDPVSAGRIHPNDSYRLTRALEITRATGKPLAEFAAGGLLREEEDFLVVGIERPREELVRRIETRVDAMFDSGLVEEFRELTGKGYGVADPGMKAIGYREFFDPGTGAIMDTGDRKILDHVRDLIVLDSKRYAKRQMTFFRALPGIVWIPADEDALARLLLGFLEDDCGRNHIQAVAASLPEARTPAV